MVKLSYKPFLIKFVYSANEIKFDLLVLNYRMGL